SWRVLTFPPHFQDFWRSKTESGIFLLDLNFQNRQHPPTVEVLLEHQTTKQPKTKGEISRIGGGYMREKIFIRTLCCLFVAIMAYGTAFAQQGKFQSGPYKGPMAPMMVPDAPDAAPFFTNFELNSCTGCTYDATNGYLVLGPTNCGIANATQWLAY